MTEVSQELGQQSGPFETRYRAFLETVSLHRPALHRYCARMTGSAMDGEDVVQEALFEAYRKLDQYDESRPLKPWLFRIAHHRCIDLLRRRDTRREFEAAAVPAEAATPPEPALLGTGKAVEHLVAVLPPKERACLLLKDVFDYSLEEIAELVDSTIGGVKAALSRARSKLESSPPPSAPFRPADPELLPIMRLYVDCFNRRDWVGVRDLVSADARLLVADRFAGRFSDAPYFANYSGWPAPWRLEVGELDGEAAVIIHMRWAGGWIPYSAIRMRNSGSKINQVTDYIHCPWIVALSAGGSLTGLTEAGGDDASEGPLEPDAGGSASREN